MRFNPLKQRIAAGYRSGVLGPCGSAKNLPRPVKVNELRLESSNALVGTATEVLKSQAPAAHLNGRGHDSEAAEGWKLAPAQGWAAERQTPVMGEADTSYGRSSKQT